MFLRRARVSLVGVMFKKLCGLSVSCGPLTGVIEDSVGFSEVGAFVAAVLVADGAGCSFNWTMP